VKEAMINHVRREALMSYSKGRGGLEREST
jgi:hypothetical protein